MKQLLLVLSLFAGLFASAQTDRYTAVRTALYEKNSWETSWTYKDGNDDVEIPVSITENVITIDSKLATSVKLFSGTSAPFSGTTTDGQRTFSGRTWKAYDITKSSNCTVDVLSYSDSKYVVLGINYPGTPAVNIRYFLLKN